MTDPTCARCGHVNPADANFCSSCGTPLGSLDDRTITFHPADVAREHPTSEVPRVDTAPPETGAVLIVQRGPNAGARYTLGHDVVRAGRHPDSDIFLDDITVSRRHVEVEPRGASYVVRDVGSLNGTYLNRERVEEAILTNGDELQIGKFKLVFLAAAGG